MRLSITVFILYLVLSQFIDIVFNFKIDLTFGQKLEPINRFDPIGHRRHNKSHSNHIQHSGQPDKWTVDRIQLCKSKFPNFNYNDLDENDQELLYNKVNPCKVICILNVPTHSHNSLWFKDGRQRCDRNDINKVCIRAPNSSDQGICRRRFFPPTHSTQMSSTTTIIINRSTTPEMISNTTTEPYSSKTPEPSTGQMSESSFITELSTRSNGSTATTGSSPSQSSTISIVNNTTINSTEESTINSGSFSSNSSLTNDTNPTSESFSTNSTLSPEPTTISKSEDIYCEKKSLKRDPNDPECKRFYWCINRVNYLMSCPNGTIFDETIREGSQCIYPEYSKQPCKLYQNAESVPFESGIS